MDALALLRSQVHEAHTYLEATVGDVTREQLHWIPPGVANPLSATYAHAVCSEDYLIHAFFRKGEPLYNTTWAGKTGVSEPQRGLEFDWGRRVQVDLPALRQYAQAVYQATDDYLASLTNDDLSHTVDLSAHGMGTPTVLSLLNLLLLSHAVEAMGEISVLKGLQGLKGYPF